MNKRIFTIAWMVFALSNMGLYAQSKIGLQMLHDEQWRSAEKEFSKSSTDEDIFYRGFCEMKIDEPEKAKTTFQSIATKPYGKIGLGWMELNAGNNEGAKKLFQEAANETKNKNADIFVAIARAIYNSTAAHKEEAIEWAKKSVDMNKTSAYYRLIYGDSYKETLDGGSAITQYEYAQTYEPNSPVSYGTTGQVYYRSRNYKDALTNFKLALEKDPNNLFALKYMAQIYYNYKVYDTAKMYQAKLIELGDKNPEDMAMMANIYFYQKDHEGAINIISEIIKGNNKYNYLNRIIGYSYQETGKNQDAINFLEKFFQTQPKDKIIASDYEYLGKAYLGIGDTVKSVEAMKQSVDLFPEDKDAMRSVADLFKKMKRNQDALELYKKLAAMPDAVVSDHLKLANIYFYQLRDFDNADAVYTKVIELSPNQVDVYFNKAKIKLFKEPNQETSSAKEDFAKYLEMTKGKEEKYKKNVVEANIYMAKDALLKLNDKVLAKTYLDAVQLLDPNHVELPSLMENVK